MQKPTSLVLALALSLAAIGCNQDKPSTDQQQPAPPAKPAATPTPTPSPVVTAAPPKELPTAEFKIAAVLNTMTFDVSTFTVQAGQKVHVVFTNVATVKLPHNWVLVKPGTEAAVAKAGIPKGEAGNYLDTTDPDVLAYTPLAADHGGTSEVTFTAPTTPGNYPYICTVPGHYLKMKGTLVVTAATPS